MAIPKSVQYLVDSINRREENRYRTIPHQRIDAAAVAKAVARLKRERTRAALAAVDKLIGGHGVEYIRADSGRWGAYVVNMGDTYDATVMLQDHPRESVIVGRSWGDYIERYDR